MLGLLTLYVVWGSTYLAIRIAVETLPPFLMSGARFLVAGIILSCVVAATTGFRVTRRQCRDNAIVGGLLLLGGNGLVSWSEQKIPSGIATLIVSLGPLFLVLMDWMVLKFSQGKHGESPTLLTFCGITLGFAGLIILIGTDENTTHAVGLDLVRVMALVLACLFWSVGSLTGRYLPNPAEPFTAAAVQMLFGGLWLVIAAALAGELNARYHPILLEFVDSLGLSGDDRLAAWLYDVCMVDEKLFASLGYDLCVHQPNCRCVFRLVDFRRSDWAEGVVSLNGDHCRRGTDHDFTQPTSFSPARGSGSHAGASSAGDRGSRSRKSSTWARKG